jgi:hypothetical protein
MKTLKLILVTVAGAFALALFIWGVEVTIEYVLQDLMPKWLIIGLGVMLSVLVALGLIVAAVYMLVGDAEKEDSELRVDALRAVGEMLLGTDRVGETLSSENGQFLHAVIRMPPAEWSAFKLYDANVACQDGCYYLFFVVENRQPTLLPIPFGAKTIACTVTNIYEYVGLRRKLLVTLYGIFRVFESVEHWIKIIVMSVCLSLKKLLEKGAEKRLAKFAGELPQVINQQSRAVLPAGIALTQVSIQFELPAKPGLAPLVVDLGADLKKGIPKLAETLRRFAPFNWSATGFLKTPYATE